jgi:hypothetical protein
MPNISSSISGSINVNVLPNSCPFCHHNIIPQSSVFAKTGNLYEIVFQCPFLECRKLFIGYYAYPSVHNGNVAQFTGNTTVGTLVSKTFSEEINTISPVFVKIYGQAFTSEQHNLLEICGVGYRKALEFLIKDYLIINNEDDKELIKSKLLWPCIKDYVTDDRIKSVAQRAVWLGNDETHYVRKWEGKDLQDLKKLIDLTVHWIEMEMLTKSFEDDMPA